jgi:hypothetical protein
VYLVGSKVRYMMCLLGFFRFEWVFIFSWLCNYFFEKRNTNEWCQRQTLTVMVTPTFYLFVGWIILMMWYIMDVNKQICINKIILYSINREFSQKLFSYEMRYSKKYIVPGDGTILETCRPIPSHAEPWSVKRIPRKKSANKQRRFCFF